MHRGILKTTLWPEMSQNKLSSRVYTLVKSAAAAAALPVLFIYVMVAKPDYHLMNALGHVVVPVARGVGDVITWPVRAIGHVARNIRELSTLRTENEELRVRLDAALATQNQCQILADENKRLRQEINIVQATPNQQIIARITSDNQAFHHDTFFIDQGTTSGILPGMAVMSFDGYLVGIVSDAGAQYAKVRSIRDSNSRIAVRIAGSEVYGFLSGRGTMNPQLTLLSDPEFQSRAGLTLVTSSIGGILPDGILVGQTLNDIDVKVPRATRHASVMVTKFDAENKYK